MDNLQRFQKFSQITISISCHWNLWFHLFPWYLLLPMTFFDMLNVHGGELNCDCVVFKNSIVVFLILYSSTFLSNNCSLWLEWATFYAKGKVAFMVLVADSRNIIIIKIWLLYMFSFQCGSFHVSRDDVYNDNTIVKNSIYQEFVQILMGSIGMSI
jgi:hypothetical protein